MERELITPEYLKSKGFVTGKDEAVYRAEGNSLRIEMEYYSVAHCWRIDYLDFRDFWSKEAKLSSICYVDQFEKFLEIYDLNPKIEDNEYNW